MGLKAQLASGLLVLLFALGMLAAGQLFMRFRSGAVLASSSSATFVHMSDSAQPSDRVSFSRHALNQ